MSHRDDTERPIGWQPELDDLRAREEMARALGGAERVTRQHDGGRLTVRERIDALVDRGSFHEVGAIAGKASYDSGGRLVALTPSNCVMGRATIDGRALVVCGDDFTLRGGSADASIKEKMVLAEEMAEALRLPIVRLIEGSGGGGSVKTIETAGRANLPGGITPGTMLFHCTTGNLSLVPVVALGLGSVAGLGAARLAASHYSVMSKSSAIFVAGPPVVARTGQKLEKEELGGWEIQTQPVPSTTPSTPRRRRSPARAGSSPISPRRSSRWRRAARAPTTPRGARRLSSRRCRAIRARSTACARSSRLSSIAVPSLKWAGCSGARSSPGSPASTAYRSR